MNHKIENDYYIWLLDIIQSDDSELLQYLFNRDYIWVHPMDSNRAEQGIELRYKFGHANNIDDRIISSKIDVRQCSILEMLIALAFDIEQIMFNVKYGDRIHEWFWLMVDNIILGDEYEEPIDIWLNREYDYQGVGNIFTLYNPPKPMNEIDTFMQANLYFTDHPDE